MDYSNISKEELVAELLRAHQELDLFKELSIENSRMHEEKYLKVEHDLLERIKELNCHNSISKILSNPKNTYEESLNQTVKVIQSAWQFPEITHVNIKIDDLLITSPDFVKTEWGMTCEIKFGENVKGTIEVYYLNDECFDKSNPFLKEEHDLLLAIAIRIGAFSNIRNTQKALSESENKYKGLIENLNDVIYDIDQNGTIKYISPSIEKLIGYRAEEIIGRSYASFVGANATFLSERLQLLKVEKEIEHEYKVSTKTRKEVWMRMSTKAKFENDVFVGGNGTLVDITEKKNVEIALQKSEAQHKSILAASPDAIITTNLQGIILTLSPITFQIFGFEKETDFIGHNFFELFDRTEWTKVSKDLNRLYRKEFSGSVEYIGAKKGGTKINVDVIGDFIYDPNGTPTSVVYVVRDITEKKKIEVELKKSEALHRSIIMASPDLITITDFQGKIIMTSPKAVSMFGYENENDFIGKTLMEFIDPVDHPRATTNIQKMLRGHLWGAEEYKGIKKDGSNFAIEVNGEFIKNEHGQPISLIFVTRDIKERKKLQVELQESKDMYVSILNSSPESIVTTDLEGKILTFSPTTLPLFGFPKGTELKGYPFFNLIDKNEREKIHANIAKMYAGELLKSEEYIGVKADRSTFYIDINAEFIRDPNGNPLSMIFVSKDINERKKLQKELQKSEALYSTFLKLSPEAVFITDLTGKIENISERTLKMFVIDKEEQILKHSIFELLDAKDHAKARENIAILHKGETPKTEEYDGICLNGSRIRLEIKGKLIPDELGRPLKMIIVVRDITEQKKLEIELKESKDLYSSILNASPDAIITTNLQGTILMVSPSTLNVLGYNNINEIIGHSMFDFLDKCELERANQNMIRMFNNEIDASIEYLGVRADGSNVDLDVKGNFINDDKGNRVSIVFVARNITEKKKIANELFENEKKYRELVESINDVIYEIGIDGSIKYLSPSIERILGFTMNELIGKNIFELMFEEDIPIIKGALVGLEKNNLLNPEYRCKAKDGTIKWVRSSTTPIFDTNGQVIGGNGTLTEITDRKQAQEAVKKTSRINLVTSHINEAIIKERTKKELLEEVCNIAVNVGKFQMSWIGLVDETSKELIKYTSAGDVNKYLEQVGGFTIDTNKPKGNGPTATSLRSGIPVACNDIANDPLMLEWRATALQNNFNSLIALPIKVKEDIIGAFTLYSDIPGFFNEEEIKLLVNVVGNIGYALSAIDTEKEKNDTLKALKQSQYNLNKAQEIAKLGSWIDNMDGTMYWSDEMYVINEVDKNSFVPTAESVMSIVHSDDHNDINNWIDNCVSKGINGAQEFRILLKDGSFKYLVGNCELVSDEKENIKFLAGTSLDITDRKIAEEELRKSEERYKSFFKGNSSVMILVEPDTGKLMDANPAACTYYGYTHEEMCSMNISQINVLTKAEVIEEMRLATEEKRLHFYFKHRLSTGAVRDVEVYTGVVEINNTKQLFSIIHDITNRKEAEDRLRKLSSAVEQSPVITYITNINGEIEYVNPKTTETTGYSNEELIGGNPRIFSSGLNSKELYSDLSHTIKSGKQWEGEFYNKKKNGELYYVKTIITPILNDTGSITNYLAIQNDITIQKHAEETILKSEASLKNAQEIAKMGSWEYNFATKKLSCSDYYYTLLGLNVNDHKDDLYEYFLSLVHPNDLTIVEYLQESSYVENETKVVDIRQVMPDGSIKWIQNNVAPLLEGAVLVALRGVNIDVTEKRLAEEQIKLQNERLNAIISAIPDLIFIINQDGTYEEVFISDTEKLIVPIEEIVGSNVKEFFKGDASKIHTEKIEECIEQDKLTSYEYMISKEIDEYYEARLVKVASNKVLSFIRDITEQKIIEKEIINLNQTLELRIKERTKQLEISNNKLIGEIEERKQIEELLKWNQSLLQLMSNSSPLGFLVVDNRTDEILYFNDQFCKIWGIENIKEEMGKGAFKNNDIIPFCLPVLADIPAFAESCKPLQFEDNRIVLEDEIKFINNRTIRRFTTQIRGDNDEYFGRFYIFEDISERKQSEIKLKESEKRFSLFMDYIPAAVFIKDSESRMIYANNTMESALGASKWIGIDSIELFGKEEAARIIADDKKTAQLGYQFINESFKNLDGKLHYYETQKFAILIDGQAPLIGGVAMDITERTQIAKELLKIEQSYQTVVENVNDIIFQTDAEGLWLFLNKSWETITGFSVEESIGQLFLNYVHSDDRQRNNELFEPLILRKKEYCRHEVRYLNKDGGFRWIEVFARLGLNDKDEITGTYGTLQDITERRQREEELKQLTTRLSLATHSGGIGVWDFDIENNVLVWDDQMYALYGITSAQFSGAYDAWQQGLHPDDKERGDKEIQMAISGEKDFDTEFRVIWPDGTIRYIKAQAIAQKNESGKTVNLIGTNRDITDQKNAEKALMESDAKHVSMITNISDVIGIMGIDGIMKYKSPNIEKYFGWKPEDLVGFDGWHTVHPDDLERISKEFGELINEDNNAKTVEYKYKCKDGSYKPIELTATNLINNNTINGILLNYHDITERKEAEALLEQTRENYETFFNTIDDFLWVLDEQGNIIHTNSTVNYRLEFTKEELENKSVLITHPVDRREEAGRIVGEMLRGEAEFCPVPLITKSDKQIPVETRVKPGFWNNQPVIFGVSKDVSQIQLSEQKFSSAFHSNSAMMAISSFDDGKYLDVNNAFIEVLGYTYEEIIGNSNKDFGIFVNPDLRAEIINNLDNNIAVRKLEVQMNTKDGVVKTGLLSADIIFIGDVKCTLTVNIDITDRKIAEEEIRKARLEAERANMAKSEFLSRMSHELRTPMNSILGFAQLLEMGELNKGQKKGVNHILKSGKHLLDLINEVLDISRIEAGRLSLSLEPVEVKAIILEMLDIVQPSAHDKQIKLDIEYAFDRNIFTKADKQRLKQVLLNLINNAIKYNNNGGTVKIKTEIIQSNIDTNNFVRVSIIDNGIGINEDNISKIFTPFERIGAEKTETEGTGLGLSVVKKLIDAMGGSIGVESVLGHGSTFWFELPEYDSLVDTIELKDTILDLDVKLAHKTGTILYIEDNLSNIELVEQILTSQRSDIDLVTNINGRLAVPLAIEHKPDLILLDLNLPDIHGSEVLFLLQNNKETKSIPVIIITADAMSDQYKKLIDLGAKNYLTKPLDLITFLDEIDKYINV